ncbi:MAG: type IV pilus twitching motility protein PilT [Vicinamibacterales bacterium]
MTQQKTGKLAEVAQRLLFGDDKFTDIHFESDRPVMMRRAQREWVPVLDGDEPVEVSHHDILEFVHASLEDGAPLPSPQSAKPGWLNELFTRGSLHYARGFGDAKQSCRLRCTVQLQFMRESIGLVMRKLTKVPDSLESLGLPAQVGAMLHGATSGLIVVTGPTGSGKSTTLAAMINEINAQRYANILTLEDPIEFEHERKKSIINQRELELDFATFHQGVRDALRFVPDVMLIGEIRDAETMRAVLRAGESGHLVLTSMHASTSVGAIKKMLSYVADNPGDAQALAGCLVGVVGQALVRERDGDGSALVYEYLDVHGEPAVPAAIMAFASDQSGRELSAIDDKLRAGGLGRSLPMVRSARELANQKKIDPLRAAGALTHPEDRKAFLAMATVAGAGASGRAR